MLVAAGQHLAHHLVQVLQRGGLDAVERGDAHHHLVALALGEDASARRRPGRSPGAPGSRRRSAGARCAAARPPTPGPSTSGSRCPMTSPPCRMRSISRLALSSPSALRSTLLHVLVGVAAPACCWSPADVGELVQHRLDPLARDRLHLGDGLAQALHFLGREVLEDLGGLLLAQRHQQDGGVFEALVVQCHVGALRVRQAGFPLTQLRTMLATAAGFSLGQRARLLERLSIARRFQRRRPGPAARRRRAGVVSSSTTASSVRARRRPAAAGQRRPCSAGRISAEEHDQRQQRQRDRHGAAARSRSMHLGLLPHRRRRSSRPASTLNGALITFTESPRSLLEADALLHQRGQLLDLFGRQRRGAWSCPWRR